MSVNFKEKVTSAIRNKFNRLSQGFLNEVSPTITPSSQKISAQEMPSVQRNHHLKTSPYANVIQMICTFYANRKSQIANLWENKTDKNKKKNTTALLKLRVTKWSNDHINPQVVKEPKRDQNSIKTCVCKQNTWRYLALHSLLLSGTCSKPNTPQESQRAQQCINIIYSSLISRKLRLNRLLCSIKECEGKMPKRQARF